MSWAVKFEGVAKRYRGGGPRYGSLRHDLAEGFKRIGGLFWRSGPEPQGKLALDDVSFEVRQGESFAIVGPNGAGKTTALRIISRITYPSAGKVTVRGRVGALIEVGSGVHPELTARENIWLYGQILGMSKNDVRRRFDAIVNFAELEEAIDTPVKMYSSGMQLRLGFAIASHLEPDVFVVDEALAVGDAGFQAKCVERMSELVSEGKALLFVSHNLSAVEAVCPSGLFLAAGRIVSQGAIRGVLREYLDWIDARNQGPVAAFRRPHNSKYLELLSVGCYGPDGRELYKFKTGDSLEVRLRFRALQPVEGPFVSIGITDGRPGALALCSMLVDGGAPQRLHGEVEIVCQLTSLPLMPRVYSLWCSVRSQQAYGDLFDWQEIGAFRITEGPDFLGPAAQTHSSTDGAVYIPHRWQVRPCQ